MREPEVFLAIDIGVGAGAKIGFFQGIHRQISEDLLPVEVYGESYDEFLKALAHKIQTHMDLHAHLPVAIGISCAGILGGDGSIVLIHNFPCLNGNNLMASISQLFGVPVGIDNDGNAGGLAEWSVLKVALIYGVLGGGWGGAWISGEGEVMFPSHDWSGEDEALHPTNEPGYSIGLSQKTLEEMFEAEKVDFGCFLENLAKELECKQSELCGPGGDFAQLRAEYVVSGVGRYRLFQAAAVADESFMPLLDHDEQQAITDPHMAGRLITKLSNKLVQPAVKADRLFGRALAMAVGILIQRAEEDGLPAGAPICLAGGPVEAMPFFGPVAQQCLVQKGFRNYLRPSVIQERGANANLMGAAVLAERAFLRTQ